LYAPDDLADLVRAPTIEAERRQHPYLDWTLRRPRHFAPPDDRKLLRMKASYFGLMTEVDHNLGRLFDHLKANDLWDNTMIIFTSDHGEQIGDHWLLGKMGYFDQSYHIPLIIRDPDGAADETRGMQLDGFTENIDIMPTLMDWLDIPVPVQCDGMSLLPAVTLGKFPSNWRTEAHWEFDFRSVPDGESHETALGLTQHQCTLNVIRSKDYKYVHFVNLPPLFFDLNRDSDELVNEAENPEYLPLVLAYSQKMLSWRMNHDEQTLTHLALTEDGVVSRPASRY
jgi:arylsulfatase A-like enzyme